ncbi:MAG: DUF4065 domain-containing protein [Prevotella sp.]|jgi:uncharacterized phage-associated protein|nr:DUF4065 domain-containing protein [Prevotella sp.]
MMEIGIKYKKEGIMKSRSIFCPECRDDTTYSITESKETSELKGETYEFISQTARCDKCGSYVDVPDIEDSNLKSLYNAYRERNDIITLEDIGRIPDMYDIGKRPLSVLLGWGEQTFSRYLDGGIPSKEYSDKLKRIFSDPAYYLDILEKGRDRLKSDNTYIKSKNAANLLLSQPILKKSNMDNVISYLLSKCNDITPLALQKALYYMQGFYSAFYSKFIFDEDCEAWIHGPVYKDVYDNFCKYSYDPIDSVDEPDISLFTCEDITLLDSIVKHICCYSGKTLEAFTHSETPWLITRGDLPVNVPSNRIISKQSIRDYFLSVKGKYNLLTLSNIRDYTKDMFSQV